MSRKISIGAALALALLLVAASIPLTMLYAQRMLNSVLGDVSVRAGQSQAIEEIREVVAKHYYAGLDQDAVTAEMVRGYIAGLEDERSRYLDPEEYHAYVKSLEGEQPDLGFELTYEPNPNNLDPEKAGEDEVLNRLVISNVKLGSPAAASGLQQGDQLLEVKAGPTVVFQTKNLNGNNYGEIIERLGNVGAVAAENSTASIAVTYMRGKKESSVSVMVGSAGPVSAQLMEAWSEDGEAGSLSVGYIKISSFYKNTARQLEEAIKDLGIKGAASYIIDLRGCAKGTLEYACEALNLLVPVTPGNESMAKLTYKDGTVKTYPSDASNIFSYASGGMAVLINGATAGVAELFAHDLRAYQPSVLLVGQKTKGVSTVQMAFPLERVGGAALLSVGRVVPYGGGEDWNADGVHPNDSYNGVLLEVSNKDMQLRNAIDALTKMETKTED